MLSRGMWWYMVPLTFNLGVAGPSPVRPTKAGRPTLFRKFQRNHGFETPSGNVKLIVKIIVQYP